MKRRISFLFSISIFWLVLSLLSDGINTLLLPQRLLGLKGSEQQATLLGLLTFTGLLGGMLVQPIAGAWSDRLYPRWGRKGVLVIGALLGLVSLIVFGFSAGVGGLAAGYIMIQLSLSVAQAAQQGFIPDQVPPRERGLAAGMKGFMDIGGAMIGFVLLGQLLGIGKPGLAVLVLGAMLIVGLGLTLFSVHESHSVVRESSRAAHWWSFTYPPGDGRKTSFQRLVLARFFFLLGTYMVGRFLLLFMAARLELDPASASRAAGNLLAGLALVTVVASLPAGWASDRLGRKPLMLAGALVSAVGTLGYIFSGSLTQLLAFGCLLSLGSAAFAGANWAMTADVVPKEESARYFGIANIGTAGAAAAAGLFGPLVDVINHSRPGSGFPALFLAATICFLVSAVILRRLEDLHPHSAEESSSPASPAGRSARPGPAVQTLEDKY